MKTSLQTKLLREKVPESESGSDSGLSLFWFSQVQGQIQTQHLLKFSKVSKVMGLSQAQGLSDLIYNLREGSKSKNVPKSGKLEI